MPLTLRTIKEINRRDILLSVARVPRSSRLLLGSSDFKIHDVDVSQQNPAARELAGHTSYVTGVRLAGDVLVSCSYDGKLIWWDLKERRSIRTVPDAHSRFIRGMAVSSDGTKVASVADDMVCRLWNASTGERLRELRGHMERTPTHFANMLYRCAFSRDGRHLATGDRVGRVVIWEVETGRQAGVVDASGLYTWEGAARQRSIGGVRSLAFSPDGRQLAVGGVGQIGNIDGLEDPCRVEVHDWARGQRLLDFRGPNGIINCLVFHPDGRWLFAAGGRDNGILQFYNVARREMVHQGQLPMYVHDVAFDEDLTTFYAVGHNKIVVQEVRS